MTRNKAASIILLITLVLSSVVACATYPTEPLSITLTIQKTASPESSNEIKSINQIGTVTIANTPSITALTYSFHDLYGCEMEMKFTSGPLKGKKSRFTILDQDYFENKGEKFLPGEKTAVYYDGPRYLILHSAFYNGNILRPLEAEFIRYYLEYWGESGSDYIENQMDELIGSKIEWTCDGKLVLNTEVRSISRLSAAASNELWKEPIYLRQILLNQKGREDEWIGNMDPYFMDTFYLGFCGWGPKEKGDFRYYYYRYLINFDLLEIN